MNDLINFFSLQDPNVRWVVLGVFLMCASSAVVGCFTLLRKRALVGDAISHAILPGVCLAFLITQNKNPLFLLLGAFVSGWLGAICIDVITTRTKLKTDAALGLVLSVFYGIGILLLTSIQNSGNAAQAGLDKFLFGKAAALTQTDVLVYACFSVLLIGIVALFYHSFKLLSFDRAYAAAKGFAVIRLETLLSVLTVIAIAIGIQAVGVVLMAALLITPAAAARYWTEHLGVMLILSALFAALSGVAGAYVSYTMPQMPTGPWIVMVLSFVAIVSVLLGRRKGVLSAHLLYLRNREKILRENILKCLYHLGERDGQFQTSYSVDEVLERRPMPLAALKRGVKYLQLQRLVSRKQDKIQLTEKGVEAGQRITKIHRLWELYLTKYMDLPADHVHDDAEAIEHIITPELEKELEHQLAYPVIDPHDEPIPYKLDEEGLGG